jgi:hypothetical protein
VIKYNFSDENEFFNYFRMSLKSSDEMLNLHSVSHAYVFSCLLLLEDYFESQMADSCCSSSINNSVLNDSRCDWCDIFKKPKRYTTICNTATSRSEQRVTAPLVETAQLFTTVIT